MIWAKNVLSKRKRSFWSTIGHSFPGKGHLDPKRVLTQQKKLSAPKSFFRKKNVYLDPNGSFEAKKALSETKRDLLEPKRSILELKGPFGSRTYLI